MILIPEHAPVLHACARRTRSKSRIIPARHSNAGVSHRQQNSYLRPLIMVTQRDRYCWAIVTHVQPKCKRGHRHKYRWRDINVEYVPSLQRDRFPTTQNDVSVERCCARLRLLSVPGREKACRCLKLLDVGLELQNSSSISSPLVWNLKVQGLELRSDLVHHVIIRKQ